MNARKTVKIILFKTKDCEKNKDILFEFNRGYNIDTQKK